MRLPPLPIDEVLARLVEAMRGHGGAVLRAPPGAGKTTRVPGALLDAGLAGDGAVLVLEPRRLAARAAARRVAAERGVELGGDVGYQVRFERRMTRRTRIGFVTEGIFLRHLQEDPFLEGIGAVVFDEFHERNLDSDLAFAMARRLRADARKDLKLVAMSATAATAQAARFLDAPVLESEGFLHPVQMHYRPPPPSREIAEGTAAAAREALRLTTGDLLVFLPGVGEIRRAARALEGCGAEVRELYGDLPAEQQDEALRAGGRRRVILATNVAETSVTVEGVTAVVDSGYARVMMQDAGAGLPRLELRRISRASAEQRAGRAGRLAPGLCLRMWSEAERLEEAQAPEIARVDLAGAALQLLAWGERDPRAFPWYEAPAPERLDAARTLLERLGAVRDGAITPEGRVMARLPVHPRLARLLVEGHRRGAARPAAMAAAILSERDFQRGPAEHRSDSDVWDRVQAMEGRDVRRETGRFLSRAAEQLERLLVEELGQAREGGGEDALLRAVFAAFPDRLARRREAGSRRGVLAGGRGVKLAEASALEDPELFVCVDLDDSRTEALVFMASKVERDWLPSEGVVAEVELEFDEALGRVRALRRTRFGGLLLEEQPAPLPGDERPGGALAAALSRDPRRLLSLDEGKAAAWLARVRSLGAWMPELGLPSFEDAELRALLPDLCRGRASLAELAGAPLLDALQASLDARQRAALHRHAPERIEVPSGSRVALLYEPGRPPVLAVRMQELFGLVETPRIAGGRVPVLLHLLAPNGRPQQVTEDLASFWVNTYPAVRAELKRRHPRHAWPEDPRAAAPERRPRRRR
ncbi:MAG: ATP-dependent helicase HrpB [Planctomycetaceae bacterium]